MEIEWEPCGHRVLVKLDKIKEDKEIRTESGVIVELKDNQKIEREKYATQTATVVAIGYDAFKDYGDGRPWCKIGDKVRVVRYSGDDIKDMEEGEIYRLINDIDIMGRKKNS